MDEAKWREEVLEKLDYIASAVGEIAEKVSQKPEPEPERRKPTGHMNRM